MRSTNAFQKNAKDKQLAVVFSKKLSKEALSKLLEDPRASLNDAKYYGDGELHEDEQKEKTEEIQELKIRLKGLSEPDGDPGFHPKIVPWISDKEIAPYYSFPGLPKKKYLIDEQRWDLAYTETYPVFPFQFAQVPLDATTIWIGKRRSGKTRGIISMLEYVRPYFPRAYVFTKTKSSGEYSKFFPEDCIFDGLDIVKLQAIFEIQKAINEAKKAGKFTGNGRVLLIVDDCLSDGLKYEALLNAVFYEGRHLGMFIMVTTQDIKGVHPAAKGNADLSFVFRMSMERDTENMKACFCDFFGKPEEVYAMGELVWNNPYHCLIFEKTSPHRDPRFTVFCGRFDEPKFPFVMGVKKCWKAAHCQLRALGLAHLEEEEHWGVEGEDGIELDSADRKKIRPMPGVFEVVKAKAKKE